MFISEYEEYRFALRTVGKTAEAAENLMRDLFEEQKNNFGFRFKFDPNSIKTYEAKNGLKLIDSGEIK